MPQDHGHDAEEGTVPYEEGIISFPSRQTLGSTSQVEKLDIP